ncbi:response regulator [uncultured Ruminococcus sp.]|uniref:response regulator n=1 Tax=uncultured Ruminococcus sp. TaxID=165186 RepID=UPI0025F913FA|nr:response regulator [uncultured Ruminococcus sp.]
MYYSVIGLLAALVLLIENRDILRGSQVYDKPVWNVYRRFLCAVLAYYVTDILWGVFEYKKLTFALYADTTLYFIAVAAGISLWTENLVAYMNEKTLSGRYLVNAGRCLAVAVFGVTVFNIFKPVLFTVDSSCVYHPLFLRYVVLICQILFLIVNFLFAVTYMIRASARSESISRYRIHVSFCVIMALCLLIQLWFPYLPLYSIAYMLGTCLLHSYVAGYEKEDYQKKLSESEKIAELKDRFRSLLDNMPCITFTKDAESGKYLACNQAFADYAHKNSPDEVLGLTDADIFDADTAAHFVNADGITLSLSKPYIFYEDVSDALGRPRQLQTTKLKYRDTSGRLCVLGICQDITDLVKIQREQAMTKEAYESAVNTGLMYTHIAQTLARDYAEMFYVNTNSEKFMEYRRDEDSNTLSELRRGWHFFTDCKKELSESVHPDDREAFLNAMNRKKLMNTLTQKDTFVMTYRRMILNKPVYYSMKISRMENDEHYIIIGFTDVDAEMREVMAKNEALYDALNLAEEANRSRIRFLSGMSHEIRTPINAIIGLDTLALKNDSMTPETRSYLEKIGDSAHTLLSLINDIIDMSRIESGKEILKYVKFSLGGMLEQISSQILPLCRKKGLKYEWSLSEQTDETYIGDDIKLKEILVNILSKVIQYTSASGSITLTAEKMTEYKDMVSLCISIHVSEAITDDEEMRKVFRLLTQRDEEDRSEFGKSDLGMMVTKRLLEMMNGLVNIGSEKDEGTAITVTVTLRRADRAGNGYTGELDLQAMNILVVDDNPFEAEHAGMVLKEAGIKADTCTSGQEALRKLDIQHTRNKPYNIVLMDWNMPGMSGAETSAAILKKYGHESIVVAMSAYNWDDIREEANNAGVENYLEKPLFASTIINYLGRIARQSSMTVFKEKNKARLDGRRILLAEDVEINAEIMTDMLEMENIKVDHAANGEIAVELFEKSTAGIYSAILMDVRMPKMDGLEAAKIIRSMSREDAKRIPIIALTANSFDEDVQLSMQAGMNAHLCKPVEAEHLISIIGELVYEAENY